MKEGAGQKLSPPRHIQGQSQPKERQVCKQIESSSIFVDSICTLPFSKVLVKENDSFHIVLVTWELSGAKADFPWLLVKALYSPEEGHETPLMKQRLRRKVESTHPVYSLSKMFSLTLFTLLTCSKIIPVLAGRYSLWGFSPNSTAPFTFHSVHLFLFIY